MSIRAIISLVLVVSVAVVVAGFATSCSDDERTCSSADECFAGETCAGGFCVSESDRRDTGVEDTGATVDSGDDLGGEVDTGSADVGSDAEHEDAAGSKDAAEDAAADADSGDEPACVVGPFFDDCPEEETDPNDEWIRANSIHDGNVGCVSDGSFEGMNESVSGTLCAREGGEWYKWSLKECDEGNSFIVEATMTLEDACPPERLKFRVRRGGVDLDCSDTAVQCTRTETMQKVQYMVAGSTNPRTFSMYAGVDPMGAMDIQSGFTVDVEVRQ